MGHETNGTPSIGPAVRLRDLRFAYPDGREALRGLNLDVQAGESVALVGPNGAGKSTLLWHLNGLLPGRARGAGASVLHDHGDTDRSDPTATMVRIDGIAVTERSAHQIRRRVGLLFQDPDDQLFSTTVLEDVAFGPLNLGHSRTEARRIAQDCLRRVELIDVADRPPHHLSLGERKRACLAGVLACEPTVLALDEPTANLDPRARRRFMDLIRGLPSTKLIATHDLDMVVDLCPRTVLLDGGRIIADGPTFDVLADADLMAAHGLEVPLSLEVRRLAAPDG